jgi:hypothetical protein
MFDLRENKPAEDFKIPQPERTNFEVKNTETRLTQLPDSSSSDSDSEATLAQAPQSSAEQGTTLRVEGEAKAAEKSIAPQDAAKELLALLETKKPDQVAYDLLDGVLTTHETAKASGEMAETSAELKL